ncbi:MAG: hypothetical protein ACRC46_00965 [Thermoguttaceae bacterium]
MSTLQFETTVAADGTITLPTSRYDAAEFVNKTVRVVVERASVKEDDRRPISFFLMHAAGVLEGKTTEELEAAMIEAREEKFSRHL